MLNSWLKIVVAVGLAKLQLSQREFPFVTKGGKKIQNIEKC